MPHSIALRGTITECRQTPLPVCEKVVYQKVAPGLGNLLGDGTYNHQRRRWVIPADPRTPAQLARRAKFALAVLTWRTLTANDKAAWQARGRNRGLPAYQAFLSAYMKA